MHLVSFRRREGAGGVGGAFASMGDAALGFETLDPVLPGARRLGALLPLPSQASSPSSHVGVVDLNRALAIKLADEDVGAPEAEADSLLPSDMLSFLRRLPGSTTPARIRSGAS